MNRLNLLLLAALLPLAVFAQGGATSSQVLADVEKTITSYGAFTVELDIDGMKSELTVNADKFYLSSADANVWYDGSTLWTYIKDAGEVNLSTPTADELGNVNPYAILRHWQDNFRHKLRGTAAGYTIVELTPLHPSDYESLTIYVDGGHNIRKLTVVFDEANLSDITISGLKRNVKVDNSMFAFDRTKHPNVDIIDLR